MERGSVRMEVKEGTKANNIIIKSLRQTLFVPCHFKNARETRYSLLVAQKDKNGKRKNLGCLLFASTKTSGEVDTPNARLFTRVSSILSNTTWLLKKKPRERHLP